MWVVYDNTTHELSSNSHLEITLIITVVISYLGLKEYQLQHKSQKVTIAAIQDAAKTTIHILWFILHVIKKLINVTNVRENIM